MIKNPYADSESLAELLWETEMVADKYADGNLMLIRTKEGWRAFLGTLEDGTLQELENSLDNNVPSYEKGFGEMSRKSNLIDELHRLLPNCMCFPGYRPMKLVEEIEGND